MNKTKKYLITILISICTFLLGTNYVNAVSSFGEVFLDKKVVKEDVTYGRSVKVNLNVNASAFSTVDKTDVVLVLDRSVSMNGDKIKDTKSAAIKLIETLLTDKTNDKVRVGVVTYGYDVDDTYTSKSLTNDGISLKKLVNSIPNTNNKNGTNIHAGLLGAQSLLINSTDTNKIVILLSDGEPYNYIGSDGKVCNYNDNSNKCKSTPREASITVSTTMKNTNNIKIYTIAFDVNNNSNAYKLLGDIASEPTTTYRHTASNYSNLVATFDNIVKDFTTVATNGVVKDIIPVGFELEEEINNNKVSSKINENGTTTITWNIGGISTLNAIEIEYKIKAKDNYYGNMYTNESAILTAISVKNNPKYGSEKPILIEAKKTTVLIPSITKNDDYTSNEVKQGEKLVINKDNGILSNDLLTYKIEDNNKDVIDKIVLVDEESGDKNDIISNENDGSFTYTPIVTFNENETFKTITYKYYIETSIIENDTKTTVKSNTSTITFKVVKNPTTYVVKYLEEGTNVEISKEKKGNGYIHDIIKENSIDINGYNLVSNKEESLELTKDNNVITFYYQKENDLKYIVNYYKDIITKENLIETITINNKIYNTKLTDEIINDDINTNDWINIKRPNGYKNGILNIKELPVIKENSVINILYTKENNLNYTVNYLEKGTNKELANSKEVNSQIFNTKINCKEEIINIDNYKFDSLDKEELIIKNNGNIINIYYTHIYGNLVIRYVDENSKDIIDSVTTKDIINTTYKVERKEISKHKLLKVIGEETGKYIDGEVVITYVYEKLPDTGLFKNNISPYISISSMILFILVSIIRKKYIIKKGL